MRQYFDNQAGKQVRDPAKTAGLMIEAVDSDAPPLRLKLGADAYQLWDKTLAARNADLRKWHDRGEATAFEGARGDSD